MSTDQERSEASERLVGLLFDGLRHGAGAGLAERAASQEPTSASDHDLARGAVGARLHGSCNRLSAACRSRRR